MMLNETNSFTRFTVLKIQIQLDKKNTIVRIGVIFELW